MTKKEYKKMVGELPAAQRVTFAINIDGQLYYRDYWIRPQKGETIVDAKSLLSEEMGNNLIIVKAIIHKTSSSCNKTRASC